MFLVTLGLAIMVGWLRGGRLGRLAGLPLRWVVLLPVPFVIRAMLLHPRAGEVPLLAQWAPVLQGLAYGLLVFLSAVNLHLPGSSFLLAGTLANAVVILANGGRMPVSEAAVRIAAGGERVTALAVLHGERSLTHQLLTPDTRLPWLADILPLPRPFPFPSVASLGDVLIAVGLFWLVLRSMGAAGARVARGAV
ncbi:MAG: hypothetical protein DIU69_03135 [Bacillota bacterium]|nr:MAG: hypothetical protein DIU69_03135 [Bacillota bacterium]